MSNEISKGSRVKYKSTIGTVVERGANKSGQYVIVKFRAGLKSNKVVFIGRNILQLELVK